MVTVVNESPPGSWKNEMDRMPWRYSEQVKVEQALATIRQAGLPVEANILAQEINVLKAELAALRENRDK